MNSLDSKLSIKMPDEYARIKRLLSLLLYDHTTRHNITWQTSQYAEFGIGYRINDRIHVSNISKECSNVITPRISKSLEIQEARSRNHAEVFTPSWVCNEQNNTVDSAWFKRPPLFNNECNQGWIACNNAISFPAGKNWQQYVCLRRLEVSCGEAPYLTSRYDTVTGDYIPVCSRIGLLDRKLRVITENCGTPNEWKHWAIKALQSVYGFDWQGDNVLLARENILCATAEAYSDAFCIPPSNNDLLKWAHIISWNIWQMDGIKCVVPNSCHAETISDLLGRQTFCECPGCIGNDLLSHNGKYSRIMDWEKHHSIRYIDLMKGVSQ